MYGGDNIKWKLGSCRSAQKYQDYREYVQRCCLAPGSHSLTCSNSDKPEGWRNGYLRFQGLNFCDDFMSYNAFRKVMINGKNKLSIMQPVNSIMQSRRYVQRDLKIERLINYSGKSTSVSTSNPDSSVQDQQNDTGKYLDLLVIYKTNV